MADQKDNVSFRAYEAWRKKKTAQSAAPKGTYERWKQEYHAPAVSAAREGESAQDTMKRRRMELLQKQKQEFHTRQEANRIIRERELEARRLEQQKQAQAGLARYEADRKAAAQEPDRLWWQRSGKDTGFQISPDLDTQYNVLADMARVFERDTSYQEINDRWDDQARMEFGYRYAQDPEDARDYAAEYNDYLNRLEKQKKIDELAKEAVDKPFVSTAKAIGAQAFGTPFETVNDWAENLGRGRITERGTRLSPNEYAGAITGAIREDLNRKGVIDGGVYERHRIDDQALRDAGIDPEIYRFATDVAGRQVLDGKGLGDVYELGNSMVQTLGWAAGTAMFGAPAQIVSMISYFGQAAASGVDDARSRGASDEQALWYGALMGAVEALAEQIDIKQLRTLDSAGNLTELLTNMAKQGVSEGLEEGVTSVIGAAVDEFTMRDKSQRNQRIAEYLEQGMTEEEAQRRSWLDVMSDALDSAIGGMVSGGVTGGLTTAGKSGLTNLKYRNVAPDSVTALVQEGMAAPEGSKARVLAEEYEQQLNHEQSLNGVQIERLARAVWAKDQNGDAETPAAGMEEIAELETTDVQEEMAVPVVMENPVEAVEDSSEAEVFEEEPDVLPELSDLGLQEEEHRMLMQNFQDSGMDRADYSIGVRTAIQFGELGIPERELGRSDNRASVLPEAYRQTAYQIGKLHGDARASREQAALKGKETPDQLKAASEKYGAQAGAMIHTYKQGQDVAQYDAAYQMAYNMGKEGVKLDYVKKTESTAYLTERQREFAWEAGQAAVSKAAPGQNGGTGVFFDAGNGNVTALGNEQLEELTGKRRAGVEAAVLLKKLGFGNDYYFFESYENAEGRRVYRDENGVEQPAPNGWYDKGNGSIHIDLNAGADADGLTLYTLSHELTHFVENWSQVKYRQLAEFLASNHGKNSSVDELVSIKQTELSESRHRDVSYEEAYSEFIADSMEGMLADGNVLEKLTQMKNTDRSLFDKVREFFSNLAKRITEFYKGVEPNSEEGQAVLKMKDQIEQIQKMFADALADADENYRAATEVGLNVDADKQNHEGQQSSDRKKKTGGFKDYDITSAVYEIRNEKAERGHDLVKIGTMPDLYRNLFGLTGDVYVSNEHLYQNMVSRADAEADGRFRSDASADYHNLGEEKIINAIEQFQDPIAIMESLKDFNEPRLVALLDEKGNDGQNLIAVLELYAPIRAHGVSQLRNHVLMTIYEKNSLPDYIEKTAANGRVVHIKNGLPSDKLASLQLAGKISEETLKKNLARFNKKVKEFREKNKINYQDRPTETISNRSLLADAFEDVAQNDIERKKIQEYRENVDRLNELEKKLQELRGEIREISFGRGKRDQKRLAQLREEAARTASRIDTYDKRLLRLEAAKPLQDVLEREKKAARQKTAARYQERTERHREKQRKSEEKQNLRKVMRELTRLLERGNKKRNVKEGMREFASKAIASAEILFTDTVTEEDLIRNGIGTELTPEETGVLEQAKDLMQKISELSGDDSPEQRGKLERKLKEHMRSLRPVFARERTRLNKASSDALFDDLARAYRELKDSPYGYIQQAYDDGTAAYLDYLKKEVNGTAVKDMTAEQMRILYKAYTMVLTKIRNANKSFTYGRSVAQEAEQCTLEAQKRGIPDKKALLAIRNLMNRTGWEYEKPVYALMRIGLPTLAKYFGELMNSEDRAMLTVEECKEFQTRMVEKYGYNDWAVDRRLDKEFMDNTGKTFRMAIGEIMSLYAYSRRKKGMRHIEVGGFTLNRKALTDADEAVPYKLTPDMVEAITGTLTKEQRGFVEEMQTFLSEVMGAKGNEVSMKLYGIKMFGEKNYFPIHMSGAFSRNAQEAQAKEAKGFGSLPNAGFTKAQNENATGVVVMEPFLDVWADHCDEMSRYHAAVPILEDIRRIMNFSRTADSGSDSVGLKALITNRYGEDALNYLDELYREANSGAVYDKLQGFGQKALGKFRKNSVAYSSSVLIQQMAAVPRAYALVPKKYFGGIRGMGGLPIGIGKTALDRWGKWQTEAYSEMRKYAPGVTIIKEIGGFDTAGGSTIRSYLLDTSPGFRQRVKNEGIKGAAKGAMNLVDDNVLANLPNLADKIAWIEIWNACKRETADKHKELEKGSEAFLKEVGKRFTEVIRATQVYDSVFAKSPLLRSKNIWVQSVVSFTNEPNTAANMLEQAVREASQGNLPQAARTFTAVLRSIVFGSALKSIVYALRDDDEDESLKEKYLSELVSSLIGDITVFNYIPIARDLWSASLGYDVERPDMTLFSDTVAALGKWVELQTKDKTDFDEAELEEWEKKKDEAMWKMMEGAAAALRIPVKNIRREIDMIVNIFREKEKLMSTGLSIGDAIEEAIADASPVFAKPGVKSRADKLYYAILEGDKTYEQRLRAGYEDQKIEDPELREALAEQKADTALRKALRENDPRIREAAEAYVTAELAEYERFAQEIIEEGFFSQNLVRDAIRAEANEILDEDPDMPSGKVKGLFTGDDFSTAVLAGDYYMAGRVRDDMIKTAKANGSTQQEAEKSFQTTARSKSKELYLAGHLTDSKARSLLETYGGKSAEDAARTVKEWRFEKTKGYSYGDREEQFFSGKLGGEELTRTLMDVEGKTLDEAKGIIAGYCRSGYQDGKLSEAEAVRLMTRYGGLSREEAEAKIRYADFRKAYPEYELSEAAVTTYYEKVESCGIRMDVYCDYCTRKAECDGEQGADGKTVSGSKKTEILEVIDSLPITSKQKDALYRLNGWAESKLWQAPWH